LLGVLGASKVSTLRAEELVPSPEREATVERQMSQVGTATETQNVLLLSTEKKVYGFDLLETFRVAIGRHDSNDLCFNSRNVSNYHAEILVEGEGLVLHDLGSTNGTYVNEERVRRRKLSHGDRIRIGSNEIAVKLTNTDGARETPPATPSIPRQGAFRRAGSDEAGTTLKQLLLNIGQKGQSMRLVLKRNASEVAVYIHEGRIIFAESGKARAEKALYRAFEWRTGNFSVEPFPANDSVPRTMTVPVETLVDEGEQQAKELDELMSKLPPPDAPLRLRESCKMRICDFTPAEMEVFQGLVRHGTLAAAMEESAMTDLRVMSLVHTLVVKRVFEMEENSSLLEQTNIITRH
jgi:pSer/pThr/pTyr-binding forkhead associated (FHA) protein